MEREFRKNSKQIEAIDLMGQFDEVLLEGGSRSGKTFIEIYAMIARGKKYPGTLHLALRKRFNHAKVALWRQTIPQVFKKAFPSIKYKENKQDYFFEFGEGSQLWIGGTDEKDRVEKILGTEWASILLNETSEQSYDTYETLLTRLNPPKGVRPLYMMDQNPGNKRHWTFKKFHLLIDPITGQPLSTEQKSRQSALLMNPRDNIDNLSEKYITILEGMSEAKRRRFLEGQYSDDTEKALWKRSWIQQTRKPKPESGYTRIIVAIDPNVTDDKKAGNATDDAGIVAVAQYKIGTDFHYDVLADETTPGLSWGAVAIDLFKRLKADKIIAEVNQGGDLVQMNLRNYDRSIADYHYDSVRATRGKEVRAEPVADLYRLGFAHHIGEFPDLENELCEWIPGEGRSPNRLDALVWAVSYLSGIGNQSGVISKNLNFGGGLA